jgi:sigma-B regulation protein RsbU (phosphoserine phosphatase)
MKERFRIPSLILYALTAITIVISIFCFVKALSWVNKPFPGFLVYYPPYVGSFSSRDWPGKLAGLSYIDRILSIDGKAVRFGQEVVNAVRDKKPGTAVHYTVQSKGELREVRVPVGTFDWRDFFMVFFPTFFIGLAIFTLGFIVYVLKPGTLTSWTFLVMCFSLGIYGITGFEIQSSYILVRFHYLILSLFPFCFVHLGLVFPERKRILTRIPALQHLIYLPPLVLALFYQIYFSTFPEVLGGESSSWLPTYVGLSSLARLFTLLGFVSLIALVCHSYFKSSTTQARTRAKMMIFGVAIAFLPVGILMIMALTIKFYFPFNFIPLFVIFFPLLIAYSIVRHNLFDADIIIRRTVGYALVTVVIIAAYLGVSISLNVFLGKYELAQSQAFPILFTLGVILIFNPLRNRIQSIVDRLFFRKEYDYGAIVEKVGGAMASLLELPLILKRLTQTFIEDMFINTTSVMLLSSAGTGYQVFLADGERKEDVGKNVIERNHPLMEIIEGGKREITKNDVLEDPMFKAVSESCAASFDSLHASLIVPLVFQHKVIGLLNLGDKKSGKSYNREDIDLLHTIANQGAVAIENARLFQENLEKQRMEDELNIARDLQMSMLPASCPKIKGFEISASSTQAREVGGDFYDFIEMGEDRVGLIVGDVTGKSVSGALIMSASRSVFRMLSQERPLVGDIMVRANERIKKDIKSGMFVALLYALLDGRDRTLVLCSAGQTQPVYYSSMTGKASLVQTEGDSFPLGILDQADYRETKVQLASGDRVVLYTDGIVEAMNDQKEIFGFERLLKIVEGAGAIGATSLLMEIINNVKDFAGGAPQHDDLTVIVVGVEN